MITFELILTFMVLSASAQKGIQPVVEVIIPPSDERCGSEQRG